MPVHVILFEPEIPPNTGNAIRLSANSGATLHLVKPLGFGLDDRNLQRSGLDYHDLAVVKVHENLDACLAQLAQSRDPRNQLEHPENAQKPGRFWMGATHEGAWY